MLWYKLRMTARRGLLIYRVKATAKEKHNLKHVQMRVYELCSMPFFPYIHRHYRMALHIPHRSLVWNSEYTQGKVFDGESMEDGTVCRMVAMERRGTLSTAAIGIKEMVQEYDVVNKQLCPFLNHRTQLLWMGLLWEGLTIGKERECSEACMIQRECSMKGVGSWAQEVSGGKGYMEVGGERHNTNYKVMQR